MALLGNELSNELANTRAEDFTPVPEGEYILQVTKTERKDTKDKTGWYVRVQFDIIAPAYQGRKLFANFNLRNNSAVAEKIGKQQFKALYTAGDVKEPICDTDQLLGAVVKASVTIREASGKYGPSNDIKNYKPAEGAMPTIAGSAHVGDAVMPPAGGGFSSAFAQPAAQPAQAAAPVAPINGGFKW